MEWIVDLGQLFAMLIFVAFLTETVVENLKVYVLQKPKGDLYIMTMSLVTGLVLCLALQVSLFTKDNIYAYYLGVVICGLVASRGGNYVHNFLDTLPTKRK